MKSLAVDAAAVGWVTPGSLRRPLPPAICLPSRHSPRVPRKRWQPNPDSPCTSCHTLSLSLPGNRGLLDLRVLTAYSCCHIMSISLSDTVLLTSEFWQLSHLVIHCLARCQTLSSWLQLSLPAICCFPRQHHLADIRVLTSLALLSYAVSLSWPSYYTQQGLDISLLSSTASLSVTSSLRERDPNSTSTPHSYIISLALTSYSHTAKQEHCTSTLLAWKGYTNYHAV